MPTKKQLHRSIAFDMMFGLSPSDHYGDEHLSPDELFERRAKNRQFQENMRNNANKGTLLGHYVWDEQLKDFKFIPA